MGGIDFNPALSSFPLFFSCITGDFFMKQCLKILLFQLVIFFWSWNATADTFSPKWRPGEKWKVKTVYHSIRNNTGTKWSDPVSWLYQVGIANENGKKFLVVDISDINGELQIETRLFYRPDDYSLAKVETNKKFRGKNIRKILDFEKGNPVVTDSTLSPHDTPVFPLVCPSVLNFEIKRRVSRELTAKEIATQTVREIEDTKDIPFSWSKGRLIEVRCAFSQKGRRFFTQYWNKNFPWPVYGENNNMKYWLITE